MYDNTSKRTIAISKDDEPMITIENSAFPKLTRGQVYDNSGILARINMQLLLHSKLRSCWA